MPRARNLKPGFFKNEELASLGFGPMILFTGLWCLADREGRLEDRPKRIKAELFPYTTAPVDKWLDDLMGKGFIVRYVVGEDRFIAIPSWKKHQNPHAREAASMIPAPGSTVQARVEHQSSRADSGFLIPDSLIPDSGLRSVGSAAMPPLSPAEFAEPDRTQMAWDLVAYLQQRHWAPTNVPSARKAAEGILANAVNPEAICASIRDNHATWAKWIAANPKERKKRLEFWLADGDYLAAAPEVGKILVSEEGW